MALTLREGPARAAQASQQASSPRLASFPVHVRSERFCVELEEAGLFATRLHQRFAGANTPAHGTERNRGGGAIERGREVTGVVGALLAQVHTLSRMTFAAGWNDA